MNIGEALRAARLRACKSQEQIAEALGVKQNEISRWERNEHTISVPTLARFADAVGVSVDELLGRPTPCPHPLPRKRKGA